MDSIKEAEQRFLRCVAKHRLTILRDEGVYRHLRFKEPGRFAYWFDLITWPGCLAIEGDCGSYTFKRLYDMFEFFRRDGSWRKSFDSEMAINPDYWAQKLEAQSCNGRSPGNVRRWSPQRFEEAVKSDAISYMRESMSVLHEDRKEVFSAVQQARMDFIEALRDEVLGCKEEEIDAVTAIRDFSFEYENGFERYDIARGRMVPVKRSFCFQDFYEHNCTDWDYQYLWNCFAIVWGIQQYDKAKRPWYAISKKELEARGALARRAA
jgi:hypothetical protein